MQWLEGHTSRVTRVALHPDNSFQVGATECQAPLLASLQKQSLECSKALGQHVRDISPIFGMLFVFAF